jgi:hypothetical protein
MNWVCREAGTGISEMRGSMFSLGPLVRLNPLLVQQISMEMPAIAGMHGKNETSFQNR